MQVAAHDVAALIDGIWLTTLGLATRTVATPDEALSGSTLDGIINITGDWQGTVAVQVQKPLAVKIAAVMFRLGDAAPTLEDMQDALGEITNMTGGNIKALLPGRCHLSLPTVVEGKDYTIRIPGAETVTRVSIECEGMRAVVSLIHRPMESA